MLLSAVGIVLSIAFAIVFLGGVRRILARRDHMQFLNMVRMLRLGSDAICLVDKTGRITWINDAYASLTGYVKEELIGTDLCDFMREGVQDLYVFESFREAVEREEEMRIDLRFTRKSGEVKSMVIELHPIYDVANATKLLGYVIVQIDIDRQRREREATLVALRERQEVLGILDTHAIVTETDLDGRITRVNRRFVEISGYDEHELLGKNHRMLGSGYHSQQFWYDMWETISQGKIWHGEICNRAKDGSFYWVDSVIAPLLGADGLPDRYISIRNDISVLKRSQDMLARTGRIAGIGGWYYDLDTRRLHLSEAAMTILERSRMTLEQDEILHTLDPDARVAFFASIKETTLTARKSFTRDIKLDLPQSGPTWVRINSEAEYLNGHPYRLIGAVQDISTQVEARLKIEANERILRSSLDALGEAFALYDAQEKLLFFNDKYTDLLGARSKEVRLGMSFEDMIQLLVDAEVYCMDEEDRQSWMATQLRQWRQPSYKQKLQMQDGRWIKSVGVRTHDGMHVMFRVDITDLQEALVAADAASRSKTQFLANMSHEIRTPMNAVMGLLQLLAYGSLNAGQRDLVYKAEGAAQSLLHILNGILDFSKVESGKMRLEMKSFVLDDLLDELSTIMSGNLGKKSLELVYDVDAAVPAVLVGDVLQLKQVLLNLAGNAIKFTSTGEVQVKIRLHSQSADRVAVAFAVEDTGIGISAEAQQRIFQEFSQAEPSTTRRFGGTGLGLAISSRLVQLMGGELHVDSDLGHGSRFHFVIDLGYAAGEEGKTGKPLSEGMSVLLLEPQSSSRAAFTRMLRQCGTQDIRVFQDIRSAQDALQGGFRPVVVVASAEVTGCMDLLNQIESMPADVSTGKPVILMTTAYQATQTTRYPVLHKPLTCSRLKTVLLRQEQDGEGKRQEVQSGKRLEGMRILLVEDNALNQEVAMQLLGREGAKVTIAGDGQQGVDALDAAPGAFDLVLMDMQMPVLDGLQATRIIRQNPLHATLPIVAMTANAMQSDKEACLAAGMNAHVGKPFYLDELVAVIRRQVGRESALSLQEVSPATTAVSSDVPALFNPELALQRLGQDHDFFVKLLQQFPRSAMGLQDMLMQSFSEGNLMQVAHCAHQLKSTAASSGAMQLSALCATIEDLAASAQQEPLDKAVADLPGFLKAATSAQEAWLHAQPAQVKFVGEVRGLKDALVQLSVALSNNDMESLDLSDMLLTQYSDVLGDNAVQLQMAMDAFDTEAALRIVRDVLVDAR